MHVILISTVRMVIYPTLLGNIMLHSTALGTQPKKGKQKQGRCSMVDTEKSKERKIILLRNKVIPLAQPPMGTTSTFAFIKVIDLLGSTR